MYSIFIKTKKYLKWLCLDANIRAFSELWLHLLTLQLFYATLGEQLGIPAAHFLVCKMWVT